MCVGRGQLLGIGFLLLPCESLDGTKVISLVGNALTHWAIFAAIAYFFTYLFIYLFWDKV